MKILLAAPEVAPFAKTGGLADVAGVLPGALRKLGHDVRVIMPLFRKVVENGFEPAPLEGELSPVIAGRPRPARLRAATMEGVPVYFVDRPDYFDRPGLYGDAEGDYPDNDRRFGFFCRGVLEALPLLDFRPDVIHLNDWQCGLIPYLLREEYGRRPFWKGIGTLLTIHNLGYQGLFPPSALALLGLDKKDFSVGGFEYYGKVSFLKAAVVYADLINTVSGTYCREIQRPEFGAGFDGILRERSRELFGILNGIDTAAWNPEADGALRAAYRADNLRGKPVNKRALQKELGLEPRPGTPLVGMVTRLDPQKGLDLVASAWEKLLKRDLQIVLLGSGDRELTDRFERLGRKFPGLTSVNIGFDEGLARRIYAGSDLFLMPSRYEPCGLGQLIALRYGSIPVVRRTGGLADTVVDANGEWPRSNGFCFDRPDQKELLDAVDRALALYPDRGRWRALIRRAMKGDFSWTRSARRYLELYRKIAETNNA